MLGFVSSIQPTKLAAIAGYIHDIGNVVSRHIHPEASAYLASQFLKELGMPVEDRVMIMSAVGNHDEGSCDAVSPGIGWPSSLPINQTSIGRGCAV